MDLVCFTLIIDDIVLPDGTTCMAQLGGGGSQSLFGFQLVSRCLQQPTRVGLTAGVGNDLPNQCKEWLQQLGCDISGLLLSDLPTPRAWQLFEWDGKRTQVWRVPEHPELYQQLLPSFAQLPKHYQNSRNYHFGIHAAHPPLRLIQAVKQAAERAGGRVSLETYTHCASPPSQQELQDLLQLCDIFSPNELEAASIVGPGNPEQLVQRLIDAGAATVALRCGAQGAWIGDRHSHTLIHVPAVPNTRVVDVTGCGNAFCGGFLAAQHAGQNVISSSMWGCVAGSIMAEWQGVPAADLQQLLPTALERHQRLQQEGVQTFALSSSDERQDDRGSAVAASCSSSSAQFCGTTSSSIRAHGIRCTEKGARPQRFSGCLLQRDFKRFAMSRSRMHGCMRHNSRCLGANINRRLSIAPSCLRFC